MTITKEDGNIMIIKDRNIIGFVVGGLFSIMGLMLLFKPNIFSNNPSPLAGIIVLAIGASAIAITRTLTVELNKMSGTATIIRKNLFERSVSSYNLSDMQKIDLSVEYRASNKGTISSYHLSFILADGTAIRLDQGGFSHTSILFYQHVPERPIGARMAAFLGIPFEERRPPTVQEALSTLAIGIQKAAEKEINKR